MTRRLDVQPQDAWKIRNARAAQVAAQVFAALPIGYWQRRVAARAWSLETVPAVPRESQQVQAWRHPGPPPTWVLATGVMVWGVIPWLWCRGDRDDVAGARDAIRRVTRAAGRPYCAALLVAAPDQPDPRVHLPRLRLSTAGGWDTVVGVITWADLGDVFAEAAVEARSVRARDAAAYGARQLAALTTMASG